MILWFTYSLSIEQQTIRDKNLIVILASVDWGDLYHCALVTHILELT